MVEEIARLKYHSLFRDLTSLRERTCFEATNTTYEQFLLLDALGDRITKEQAQKRKDVRDSLYRVNHAIYALRDSYRHLTGASISSETLRK